MIRIGKLVVIFLGVLLIFGPVKANGQFFFFQNEMVGESAPDFTLGTLNKQQVNFTKYTKDKNSIVFFWATWCPHCRVQLKELNEANGEIEKKGIKLVIVDIGETKKVVEKYVKKNNIKMDIFLDHESKVADDYGVVGVPSFYFVDSRGTILSVEHELPENIESPFQL